MSQGNSDYKQKLLSMDVGQLLTEAFGKGAEGTQATEEYLSEIPEGQSLPRRLLAFSANPVVVSGVKKDLRERAILRFEAV